MLEHAEELDAGTYHCGRQRVREEVGTRTLAQHVDDLGMARREAAHGAAEGLAQRARQDVNLAAQTVQLGDAAARLAQHSSRVALVNHNHRVILVGQSADLVQRGGIAVHREDSVRHDDAETLSLRTLQAILQLRHVGVGIAVTYRLAQTYAVDDRGVVQSIRDDGVLLRQQRLENTAVGIEARGVENRILGTEVVRYGLLKLLVYILTSADETYRRHSEAARIHRTLRRLDKTRIVRQPKIVVGAEIEYLLARYVDLGALRRADHPFVLVEAGSLDVGQLLAEVFPDLSVHGSCICWLHFF